MRATIARQQAHGLDQERETPQGGPAGEGLPGVRSPVRLAQEVGARLG